MDEKRPRMTKKQQRCLINTIYSNPEMLYGNPRVPKNQKLWTDLTETLNNMGGSKSQREWLQSYKLLGRKARRKQRMKASGGHSAASNRPRSYATEKFIFVGGQIVVDRSRLFLCPKIPETTTESIRTVSQPVARTLVSHSAKMTDSSIRTVPQPKPRTLVSHSAKMTDSSIRTVPQPVPRTLISHSAKMTDSSIRMVSQPVARTLVSHSAKITDTSIRTVSQPVARTLVSHSAKITDTSIRTVSQPVARTLVSHSAKITDTEITLEEEVRPKQEPVWESDVPDVNPCISSSSTCDPPAPAASSETPTQLAAAEHLGRCIIQAATIIADALKLCFQKI